MIILPESGTSSLVIIFIKVDLPAPDLPTRKTNSLGSMWSEIRSSAGLASPRYVLVT